MGEVPTSLDCVHCSEQEPFKMVASFSTEKFVGAPGTAQTMDADVDKPAPMTVLTTQFTLIWVEATKGNPVNTMVLETVVPLHVVPEMTTETPNEIEVESLF